MPAFTKAQAQAIAERVARQLLPEKFAQCKLVPSGPFEEPIIFALKDRTYPVVYTFTFARTVKGIPVSGNEIRVGINAETGKMQHFSVNWQDNLDVPDPSGHIAADRAAAIFAAQGLELAYAYYGPRDRDTGVRPKLVYQLKGGNFILDALTGKVQDPREGPYYFDIGGPGGGGGGEPMYSRAKKELPLSEAEQAAVEKLGRLLTAERGDDSPRAYRLEYARLVNGVVYPDNGFSVTVNATTGEVTDYSMRWWDTSFPAPAGVIDRARAAALYLEKHPLLLEYVRAFKHFPDGPDKPRYFLVYHPTGWPMEVLDAKTGQELDREGKPVLSRKAGFTDIAGHPAARDIQLLADQGIVAAEDGRFRPNDRITGGEMLAWLVAAASRDGYRPLAKEDDEQLIERARALGIIAAGEDIRAASPVTRLQAARWLVNSQGFEALARHGEIFNLKVADATAIGPADRGYVAAALAMGYLAAQPGGRFGPEGTVTRGEAATMLVRALSANGVASC